MFSSGQLKFAVLFAITFFVILIFSYRKDIHLHKIHYKNAYFVAIAMAIIIALFTMITFSMH